MSTESSQKWLERNRPPRVQISYDVETGGASAKRELPMVVGIVADLGAADEPISKRRFIEIDRDNFNQVMKTIAPTLSITGVSGLSGTVAFESLEHFEPDHLVQHVDGLKELFQQRQQLRDLMAKIDGNDRLHQTLLDAVAHDKTFATWGVELKAKEGAAERKKLTTLTADQVKALAPAELAAYSDAELGALSSEQLGALTQAQVEHLKERTPFTATQIGALASDLQPLLKPKE